MFSSFWRYKLFSVSLWNINIYLRTIQGLPPPIRNIKWIWCRRLLSFSIVRLRLSANNVLRWSGKLFKLIFISEISLKPQNSEFYFLFIMILYILSFLLLMILAREIRNTNGMELSCETEFNLLNFWINKMYGFDCIFQNRIKQLILFSIYIQGWHDMNIINVLSLFTMILFK